MLTNQKKREEQVEKQAAVADDNAPFTHSPGEVVLSTDGTVNKTRVMGDYSVMRSRQAQISEAYAEFTEGLPKDSLRLLAERLFKIAMTSEKDNVAVTAITKLFEYTMGKPTEMIFANTNTTSSKADMVKVFEKYFNIASNPDATNNEVKQLEEDPKPDTSSVPNELP
jgi:hypothetical protein